MGYSRNWDNVVNVLDDYIREADGLPDLVARFVYSGVKKFAFPRLSDTDFLKKKGENEAVKIEK